LSIRVTRRACIIGLPFGLSGSALFAADPLAKGHTVPTEARRFADPATELEVVRLTDSAHTSVMAAPHLRSISRHMGFFLYSSDRSGTMQAWRMELKTGESRLLTSAEALDPSSLALSPDERGFYYFDGDSLKHSFFSGLHESGVYTFEQATGHTGGFALSDDGMYAAFGAETSSDSRLLLLDVVRRTTTELSEQHAEIADPMFRPHRAQVLYRRDGALWLVDFTGKNNRKLKTVEGGVLGPARWSPSGRTVYYLHFPGGRELNTLRELTPDDNTERLVSKTSQFVQFGINGDASVFVGASRNPGSPYVLLLLRVNRRELSLCEHHSSDPAAVSPVFSPDSQRIFFTSDRDGKPAIYRIRVEKFVEETEGQ
jgi:oligogalacturonide lyase